MQLTTAFDPTGDFALDSWVDDNNGRCRMISTSLSGSRLYVCRLNEEETDIVEPLHIAVTVKKTKGSTNVCVRLSDVRVNLSYTDYNTIVEVSRSNLAKKVDKTKWDNLEAKWERESMSSARTEIVYADSARHVRYGVSRSDKKRNDSFISKGSLILGRLTLLLKRTGDHLPPNLHYEMLLCRGQGLEATGEFSSAGKLSVSISLRNIFVFDLGESGRLLNAKQSMQKMRPRRALLMIEGYTPTGANKVYGDDFDSHLLVKADKEASSNTTKLTAVVNCLSITALHRCLLEVSQFFTCSWGAVAKKKPLSNLDSNDEIFQKDQTSQVTGHYEFRLVLHYPRLIFVADEKDAHSKALVLQGYVELSLLTKIASLLFLTPP